MIFGSNRIYAYQRRRRIGPVSTGERTEGSHSVRLCECPRASLLSQTAIIEECPLLTLPTRVV